MSKGNEQTLSHKNQSRQLARKGIIKMCLETSARFASVCDATIANYEPSSSVSDKRHNICSSSSNCAHHNHEPGRNCQTTNERQLISLTNLRRKSRPPVVGFIYKLFNLLIVNTILSHLDQLSYITTPDKLTHDIIGPQAAAAFSSGGKPLRVRMISVRGQVVVRRGQ